MNCYSKNICVWTSIGPDPKMKWFQQCGNIKKQVETTHLESFKVKKSFYVKKNHLKSKEVIRRQNPDTWLCIEKNNQSKITPADLEPKLWLLNIYVPTNNSGRRPFSFGHYPINSMFDIPIIVRHCYTRQYKTRLRLHPVMRVWWSFQTSPATNFQFRFHERMCMSNAKLCSLSVVYLYRDGKST